MNISFTTEHVDLEYVEYVDCTMKEYFLSIGPVEVPEINLN